MLFHRNLRDGIPVPKSRLTPNRLWVIAANQREQAFSKRNREMMRSYNEHTRKMAELEIGQEVSIQESNHHKIWLRFGTVVDKDDRKYTIRVHGSGRVITRNRRFLKPLVIQSGTDDIIISADVSQPSDVCRDYTNNNIADEVPANESSDHHTPSSSGTIHTPVPEVIERPVKLPRMVTNLFPHNNPGLKE